MKHDFSDVVPENFYTPEGHINFETLVSREDHLCALSVAERALSNIEEYISGNPNGSEEWRQKADAAHKRWTWLLARIRGRLSVFKSREKNVKLSRSVLIRKYLVQELKKHVPHSVYKECERAARKLAQEEANSQQSVKPEVLNEKGI
ncbi:hypothetical protein [Yersinia frederiksenii]|uniref:hypothetical protein n=1 Tax=Yersinia frederiksenii TaxID=29484 RepID=UPI0005E2C9E4|nr:hypothetical protein [Yersinia frederiksenii]CQH54804.1 Uncharacterised protein [Yersinia frederiksenii]